MLSSIPWSYGYGIIVPYCEVFGSGPSFYVYKVLNMLPGNVSFTTPFGTIGPPPPTHTQYLAPDSMWTHLWRMHRTGFSRFLSQKVPTDIPFCSLTKLQKQTQKDKGLHGTRVAHRQSDSLSPCLGLLFFFSRMGKMRVVAFIPIAKERKR